MTVRSVKEIPNGTTKEAEEMEPHEAIYTLDRTHTCLWRSSIQQARVFSEVRPLLGPY